MSVAPPRFGNVSAFEHRTPHLLACRPRATLDTTQADDDPARQSNLADKPHTDMFMMSV